MIIHPVKRIFKPYYGLRTLDISQDIDRPLRVSRAAESLVVSIPYININPVFTASVQYW
jgi:hypothetical protein